MSDSEQTSHQLREISKLLKRRLGARGHTLAEQLKRARRRLPASARGVADYLATAEDMAAHPRLRLLIDPDEFTHAANFMRSSLRELGTAPKRTNLLLNIMTGMALSLLAGIALLIAVLVWRGFI